jgi:putative two-component system response regulator
MGVRKPDKQVVLVVEDDDDVRGLLAAALSKAGYAVVLAVDGQQALDILAQPPLPDLILLDMLMPGMDGWHFLRHVKAQPPMRAVPIVVMTGTILTLEWAQAHGGCGILHKPIALDALLREVQRCMA